jgi:hypothetical protein
VSKGPAGPSAGGPGHPSGRHQADLGTSLLREGNMAAPSKNNLSAFWEFLHAALGLQHAACCLAQAGSATEAVVCERQALSLLLEATCLLEPDEPALSTVRTLATAGLARLQALKPSDGTQRTQPKVTRARGKTMRPPARPFVRRTERAQT